MSKNTSIGELFPSIAAKYLSSTDVDPLVSNGHEIGGLSCLKDIWGEPEGGREIIAHMAYLDDSNDILPDPVEVSWYNSRRGKDRAPEWRIYYPNNSVTLALRPGDFIVVAAIDNGEALFMVAPTGSKGESDLRLLFNIEKLKNNGTVIHGDGGSTRIPDPKVHYLLDLMGIVYDNVDYNLTAELIARFPDGFPSTNEFSGFAREHSGLFHANNSPDELIAGWFNHEETLFAALESHFIEKRLKEGFSDTQDFLSFSLSVQNRRKSRAGRALENHIEFLFRSRSIHFTRSAQTELKKSPDFLFPSKEAYQNATFPSENLAMLGVKSTLKDRWRQVISEAARIPRKHLLTLEPRISTDQIREIQSEGLQLVIPSSLHSTFSPEIAGWLWSVSKFCDWISCRQGK